MIDKNGQIIIRKARILDVPNIIPLFRGIAQYHHNFDKSYIKGSQLTDDWSQRLTKLVRKRNSVFLVAEVDKKIVGYFTADIRKVRIFADPNIGFISNGYIDAKYRRNGIGKMMMKWLKDWFSEKGIKRVELNVDIRNDLGIKAWQKYGFREYQKRMSMKI